MSSEVAIKVENLSKCYQIYDKPRDRLKQMLWHGQKQFYREFWALRDVSFEVYKGESVGIIGCNGAGKSTLLQIIAGTLSPSSGSVKLRGRVAALLELGSGFNSEFSGKENIYLNAAVLGLTKSEIDSRYEEILEFADIGEFINQPVKNYSSGMVVRLAFAVQVMVDPNVLIVDEALAVGDALFQRKCYARMESLIQKGTTLFLVTHDTEAVKRMCNKAIYIKNGKLIKFGKSIDVVASYLRDLFPVRDGVSSPIEGKNNILKTSNTFTVSIPVSNKRDSKRYCYQWIHADGIKNEYVHGIGGGKIDGLRMYGLVRPNILPEFGSVCIEIDASWSQGFVKDVCEKERIPSNIYLGYGVANEQNIRIFGGNTCSEGIVIDPQATSRVTVFFDVEFPKLKAGTYFVVVALSLGTFNSAIQLWWSDFTLQVVSINDVRGGFFAPKTSVRVSY